MGETNMIREGGLDHPDVQAMLAYHQRRSADESPVNSDHALGAEALVQPDIRFFTCWAGERLLGMAALKTLAPDHGELKSLHVHEDARGHGIGRQIVSHIINEAHDAGMTRISLETGTTAYFDPAERLYRRLGFVECLAFAPYVPDPHSLFLTLAL